MQGKRRSAGAVVNAYPGGTRGKATAVESYHALLRSDPDLSRTSHERLVLEHEARGLRIRDRLLCNVLRPRFMSPAEETELAAIASTIAMVLERAGKLLLSSDALIEKAGANEAEREIWAVDPGYEGITLTSRLDSFMKNGGLRFIEYNAESPAGIGFCDCLTEVFTALPVMRSWNQAPPQRADGRAHLLRVLLEAYREWGGAGTPVIAIIDWADVITRRDFELCAEFFRENGLVTVICDPRELSYRKGKVWLDEQPIDLVYRRVLLHELLERAEEARPLLHAYGEGAVCMINSPRSKLLHKKTVFAMLSEGSLPIELTPEEQAVIDATVPWTRRVAVGETTWRGENVDLIRLLLSEKDRFAVKPADDYGGRGVVLGWETSREGWERELESAADGGYVVQERVDVPEEEFPVWRDGALEMAPLLMDTNPLLFKSQMGCVLTRLSGSALLNVTAGTGSTTPTFVLREE